MSSTIVAFCKSLDRNQANHLRVILSMSHGADRLRSELGTQKTPILDEADARTGAARRGRTIDLFPDHLKRPGAANIVPLDQQG
jgi:hypothetical protein